MSADEGNPMTNERTPGGDRYASPQPIDDVTLAFPAAVSELLPPADQIPDDYPGREFWLRFAERWWAGTLPEGTEMHAQAGVDAQAAGRHLTAILRSFEPKHEHKISGAAWLACRWFAPPAHPTERPEHRTDDQL